MSMKLYKEAYEQLISEDIKALNDQMAHCPESSHIENVLKDSVRLYYPEHISTVQDCELAITETKKKAIEAFKENCQHPKDTAGCECKLCVRWVAGHCELLDGFIEKLNS